MFSDNARWLTDKPFEGGSYSGGVSGQIEHNRFKLYLCSGMHTKYPDDFRSWHVEGRVHNTTFLSIWTTDRSLLPPNSAKQDDVIKWFMSQMTFDDVEKMIDVSYELGVRNGKSQLKEDLRKLFSY